MTDQERIAGLEARLEEARKDFEHLSEAMTPSGIFWDWRGIKALEDFIAEAISKTGRPSPLAALKDRVIEAARKVHENHCCKTPAKCSGIEDFGWELSPALAALDSAQRKEK